MAKSKIATRAPASKNNQKSAASPTLEIIEQERSFPLSFISLPEFLSFAVLCLLLVATPYGLSGFPLASLELLGGDAYQPLATLLAMTACSCLLLAIRNHRVDVATMAYNAKHPVSPICYLIGAFLLWCCVSAITAVYLHDALVEVARVGGCIAWFCIVRTLLMRSSLPVQFDAEKATQVFYLRRFWVLHAITCSALLVCMIAVVNFAYAIRYREELRQFSTFYNPNLFANFCAMALPLTIAWAFLLLRFNKRGWLRLPSNLVIIIAITLPLLTIMGLLVSASKGGLLAMLVGLLAFVIAVWHARNQQLKAILHAHYKVVAVFALLLLVLGGAVMVKSVLPRLLATNTTQDHSTMFRYYTWIGTSHMVAARPLLGWGPGNFPWAYPPFEITHYVMTAHHVWLQIAAENGVPALLLLAGVIITAGVRAWRTLHSDDWPVAAGGLGTLAAFVAHGLTDSGWSIASIVLLLFTTLALIDTCNAECEVRSAEYETQNSKLKTQNSTLAWSWIAACLVVALAAAGMQRVVGAENANYDSYQLAARQAYTISLSKAQEATETDSLSARAWLNLARLQTALNRNPDAAFERATQLQPTRAANWAAWAQTMAARGDMQKGKELFNRAVALDPNSTGIRLSRSRWLMSQPPVAMQTQGWKDLEHIAWLATQPYGRFPATPEFVNLDFARAYVKLAERALQQGKKTEARTYIERGLHDVDRARAYEDFQRLLAAEVGSGNMGPAKDLSELETELNRLKEQVR